MKIVTTTSSKLSAKASKAPATNAVLNCGKVTNLNVCHSPAPRSAEASCSEGFIRFNLDALLRGTTLERYDAYTKGLREGFLSLNDVHAYEDMAPIESGDQYRVPLQNIDATDAKEIPDLSPGS